MEKKVTVPLLKLHGSPGRGAEEWSSRPGLPGVPGVSWLGV